MTDKEIYDRCCEYGAMSLKGRRKFVTLLPEVAKRGIHRKYGFGSIYEFGAKLCGLSRNVVNEALRVYGKIQDKPELLKQFKEKGVNKVRIVANIATKQTDKHWAKKVGSMTKPALETHVKDVRNGHPGMGYTEESTSHPSQPQAQDSLFNTSAENSQTKDMSIPRELFSVKLDPKTIQNLKILKSKMKKGATWEDVFCWFIELATPEPKREYKQRPHKSRQLPAKQKMSEICEVPGCNKPATEIHHIDRWSITKNHKNVKALCKSHHELAHRGYLDEENELKPLINAVINPIKAMIDRKMLGYLRGSTA